MRFFHQKSCTFLLLASGLLGSLGDLSSTTNGLLNALNDADSDSLPHAGRVICG
jgi:hypothetical protein